MPGDFDGLFDDDFKRTRSGVLEVLPEGWGFVRQTNHDPVIGTIYVDEARIKHFDLKTGDTVTGQVRPPKDTEIYYSLLRVDSVNGRSREENS